MRTCIILITGLFCWGCNASPTVKNRPGNTNAPPSATVAARSYEQCRQEAAALRQLYRPNWTRLKQQEKENIFTRAVAEKILPAWTATPWNFNGTTETPDTGSIACGYFVTTTLRDAGLPLQRVKLAQCASEQMICTLVQPGGISRFSNIPHEKFVAAMKQQGYGLYIVGLDNHTGFLYHNGTELYFIHAAYNGSRAVVKETAAGSAILAASRYRITGKLSADEQVLNRWINAK